MQYKELIAKLSLIEKCSLLSGKDVWHTRAVEHAGIPSITLSDGPSGLRKQAGEGDHLGLNASTLATCFPSAATLANSWNTDMARQVGAAIGEEARAQDVQVLLGPGLNTKRSPLCGRNFEYFSEDPYLAGKLAAGFIQGVQSQGVSACAKHFAANSQEGHRMASDSVMDERTLREMYLTNFEIAVKEGKPGSVMSAYNMVNGVYANENPHLLEEILRREWGFEGAVVTDWGGSNSFVEGTRMGSNLEMPSAGDDSVCQLVRAVEAGEIDEAVIDERVDQLLGLIMTTAEARQPGSFDKEAHHALAMDAARDSIVLLKNNDNILPLNRDCRVAVIGDFARLARYQGAGSSMVNPTRVTHTRDVLSGYFPQSIGFAAGFPREDKADPALTQEAMELARKADCVLLYLGLTESFETEGLDRTHMHIPDNQVELLNRLASVNERIIVVLSAGSAVEMPWLSKCQALVYGCLGGQAGAEAMLQVLSGQACPGGKLAETFPIIYGDMPVCQYYPGEQRTSEYREGIYVGYRYFVTSGKPVRFPFGFGLSYTSFQYSNLSADDKQVSFDLTNTGSCAGSEIAQVYIGLPGAEIFRPRRELKGFARVTLQPGETQRVVIPLDDKAFRYFNVKTNRFEIEGGAYDVMVCASSEDIRLSAQVQVKGTDAPNPYVGEAFNRYRQAELTDVSDAAFSALLDRPIPPHGWDERALLQMNDALMQLYYARNIGARFIGRLLNNLQKKSIAKGKPDLNILFIYNMPFRGIAKMMNGMVSMEMAEAILTMANGHFFKGLGGLVSGFMHRPKLSDLTKEK